MLLIEEGETSKVTDTEEEYADDFEEYDPSEVCVIYPFNTEWTLPSILFQNVAIQVLNKKL